MLVSRHRLENQSGAPHPSALRAAALDKHAQLVEADQRFQVALDQAIAEGGERKEAVEATVALKKQRRSKLTP